MALSTKVGSFNIDSTKTVGQTQSVSGIGFQPKIVIFWWSGGTATGDSVSGGNICMGMGAAISATERRCMGAISDDNVATSNAGRFGQNADCIRIYSDGTPTLDGIMDFYTMDSDGFTLIVDDQFSANYRISYLALGGSDLTNYSIGYIETPATTGEYDAVTGLAYQPDAVLILSAGAMGLQSTNGAFGIGMATGSSAQGVNHVYLADANTSSYSQGYSYDGEVFAYGIVNNRDSFVQFNSDGFRLNHLEGTTIRGGFYITLKGAQFKVGNFNTRTDGNDIVVNDVGFQPSAILFASTNRAKSTQDTVTAHGRVSIGAATSASNRACAAISSENGLAATETALSNNDNAVYQFIQDDAIVGQMDIKSIDSSGFTCVMDDSDPSACWINYLAIGASETSLTVNNSSHIQSAGNILLAQIHNILVNNSQHINTVENISLAQVYILSIQNSNHVNFVESLEINLVSTVIIKPISDTSLGSWTDQDGNTINIYQTIDEASPSDSDYVKSPFLPVSNTYKFKLESIGDPEVHYAHKIRFRFAKPEGASTTSLKVRVLEGANLIASWEEEATESFVTIEHSLTELEVSAIADYSNLYVELEGV